MSKNTTDEISVIKQLSLADRYYFDQSKFKKAIDIWQSLADQNVVAAHFEMGLAYSIGCGVERDYAVAHKWFLSAVSLDKSWSKEVHSLMRVTSHSTGRQLEKSAREFINITGNTSLKYASLLYLRDTIIDQLAHTTHQTRPSDYFRSAQRNSNPVELGKLIVIVLNGLKQCEEYSFRTYPAPKP